MPIQNAARAAVSRDAEGDPRESAKLASLRSLDTRPIPTSKRTEAHLGAWTARALDAGARLRGAAAAWSNGVAFRHPESIGAAFEQIDEAKGEIDHLVERALFGSVGPSRELIAEAAGEYHAQRGGAVNIVYPHGSNGPQRQAPQKAIHEPSEATTRERERLRRAHPAAWAAGERAGLRNEGAPSNFAEFSADQKAAFFSAAHLVRLAKLREKK